MSYKVNGELVPIGGGDNIPLIREKLTLGRRETCDVCQKVPNVSGLHAEMSFREQDLMVFQLQLTKRQDVVPMTRDYIVREEQRLRTAEAKRWPPLRLAGE